MHTALQPLPHIDKKIQCDYTYCSIASLFIPSSKTPVTLSFKYRLAGAPCGAALDGIGAGSGAATPLVLRTGVDVRGTSGADGAIVCCCGEGEG